MEGEVTRVGFEGERLGGVQGVGVYGNLHSCLLVLRDSRRHEND